MDPFPEREPLAQEGSALWPERLRALGARLRVPLPAAERGAILGEVWVLLNLALGQGVRGQAYRVRHLSADDVVEIAAGQASELLLRIDAGEWGPADLSATQLRGFLATVARNGVVDLYRKRRREVSIPDGFDVPSGPAGEPSPALAVDGDAYARAIADCAGRLTRRARRAWYLRALYEIRSADIARDPGVATTPAGVDAMLARCREQMRACLEGKGLPLGPLPPGTFVRLWEREA